MRKLFHQGLDDGWLVLIRALEKSKEGFVLDVHSFKKECAPRKSTVANEISQWPIKLPWTGRDIQKSRVMGRRPTPVQFRHAVNGFERQEKRVSQRCIPVPNSGDFDGVIDVRDDDYSSVVEELDVAGEPPRVSCFQDELKIAVAPSEFVDLSCREGERSEELSVGLGLAELAGFAAEADNNFSP